MKITAYVPCFNNARTLPDTLKSIKVQTVPVDELFIIDDGSSDGSDQLALDLGCRVIRNEENLGRGATRARAMSEASCELVLACDATNAIPPDFVERALPWFESDKVAAVFGRMSQRNNRNTVSRWRARHLLLIDVDFATDRHAPLITQGVLMRKAAVEAVGNFNPDLRHGEDGDLGTRLLADGYEVVFDPNIPIMSLSEHSLMQTLERYWRWNYREEENSVWTPYLRQVSYSLRVLARADFLAGDLASIPISLIAPHYQFWRSHLEWVRKHSGS